MPRLLKYVVGDILRGRIVLGYAGFLLLAAFGLFNLAGDLPKGLVGLLSLVLIAVPLVSIVFASSHYYQSYEFLELLAAQPLPRTTILLAQAAGVSLALCGALLVGIGLPLLVYTPGLTALSLLAVSLVLTVVFTHFAFLAAVALRDKGRGIGFALLVWFYFALLHDGLTLYVLFLLQEYPLEGVSLGLLALNPIDLARVLVLLQMDVSALLGYTGALLKDFLGTGLGLGFAAAVLAGWIALPLGGALWVFRRKDL
ncbi:MAG: ABC transporter permease [Opitutus sp.]|nr:ABC transporter permease [Opitutus sp.]